MRALLTACVGALLASATCFASTVTLQWSPSSGAAGYRVYYKADSSTTPFNGTGAAQGASPVDLKNNTSATITGLDPLHAYYFAVTAYNSAGAESAYSSIVAVPELTPPSVSITYPGSSATVTGTVSVTASASDNVGVTKVEFYVNGVLQATDTASPYLFSWNTSALAAGTYTLTAKAYDAAGNVGQSSAVSVTAVKDTTAPTASITAPATASTVSGTVTVTASGSDNVGVTKMELYENGVLKAAGSTPLSYSWNTAAEANGSVTLTAKSYDAAGNVGTSSPVSVTINNAASTSDTTAPTAALTAPAAGATVSGTVAVTASASDNVGVSKVEFYVNGVLKATDTATPYTYSWDTTSAANGTYTLAVKAYDAAGNSKASSNVSVSVNNTTATTAPIAFVQVAAATPQTPTQTVAVTYPKTQTAGNLNVVVVGWNDTTANVQSVTDSAGNVYSVAAATTSGNSLRQAIYYAKGIKAATNKVTVTFSQGAVYPDIRILEYSGISAVDKTASASGTGSTSSTPSVTTTTAKELVFGANTVSTGTGAAGSGYTSRIITSPDSDIAEDRTVSSLGTYSATAPMTSSGNWVMQMVTFK